MLSNPVSVDTLFGVNVSFVYPGNTCGTGENVQSFSVTVPAGSSVDDFSACLNGAYFPSGAVVCSACITSCNNPAVNFTGASC